MVLCCTGDGVVTYVSPACRILTGFEPDDVIGHNIFEFLHPDEHEEVLEGLARWQHRKGEPRGQVQRVSTSDGRWVELDYDAVIDPGLDLLGSVVVTFRPAGSTDHDRRDLLQRVLNEDRLVRLASTFLRHGSQDFDAGVARALRDLAELEWVTRLSVWVNRPDTDADRGADGGPDPAGAEPALRPHTVWSAPHDAPVGELPSPMHTAWPRLAGRLGALEETHLRSVAHLPDEWERERKWLEAAGVQSLLAVPMVADDELRGCVMAEVTVSPIGFDITHLSALRAAAAILSAAFERDGVEQEMHRRARTDVLTGLANRWTMEDRLHEALGAMARGESPGVGVATVNLDQFAQMNQALGREAGDELLRRVAARLARADDDAWVARLHGDEFVVVWEQAPTAAEARRRSDALLEVFDAPFDIDGRLVWLSASVGVAHASVVTADDVASLLGRSDVASRRARSLGGARVEVEEAGGGAAWDRNHHIDQVTQLRAALSAEEIVVHYQAEWDLAGGGIVGAEALARWQHSGLGLLSASSFIPLAEGIGVIERLGAHVLRVACADAAAWPEVEGAPLVVRVNLSPNQLLRQDVISLVGQALADSGLPPARLTLELTENALLVDPDRAVEVLGQLRALGCGVAIDDFGTGYSSLLYLKRLPVTSLKIDKAFVDGLPDSEDDLAIVEAILKLAGTFGVPVTAEGVEQQAQADLLASMGCPFAQGFLLGRPEPHADFMARLR